MNKKYSSQLHKQTPHVKYYFPITGHKNDIQIDLMDMSNVSTMNKNFKFALVAVDIFTRKGMQYQWKIKLWKVL